MKIEVHLQGGLRKIIDITPGATVGATVGVNLRNPDGTMWVPPSTGGGPKPSITSWELILNIPANVTALANTTTTGLYTITGPGTSMTRALTAVAGETTVANGDGVAGNPTVGLADVTPSLGGSIQRLGFDAKGRRSEADTATTDNLPEGAANLYFTDERAQDAVGTILVDTASVNLTYNDGTPSISADVIPGGVSHNLLGSLQGGEPGQYNHLNNNQASSPILDTYASRPAPTDYDRVIFHATDVKESYVSDGATWTLLPSGGNELGYAETTVTFNVAAGATADVPGMSTTVTVGESDINVSFGGTMVMNFVAPGEYANLILYVDGVYTSQILVRAIGDFILGTRSVRLSGFTPGSSHTFKLGLQSIGGAGAQLAANANDRPYLQVVTI